MNTPTRDDYKAVDANARSWQIRWKAETGRLPTDGEVQAYMKRRDEEKEAEREWKREWSRHDDVYFVAGGVASFFAVLSIVVGVLWCRPLGALGGVAYALLSAPAVEYGAALGFIVPALHAFAAPFIVGWRLGWTRIDERFIVKKGFEP